MMSPWWFVFVWRFGSMIGRVGHSTSIVLGSHCGMSSNWYLKLEMLRAEELTGLTNLSSSTRGSYYACSAETWSLEDHLEGQA